MGDSLFLRRKSPTNITPQVRLWFELKRARKRVEADFSRCHRTYVARAAVATKELDIMHITAKTTIPEPERRAVA